MSFCNSFFGLFLVVLAFFVVVFVSFCGCSLSLLVALCFFCVVLCHFIVVLCLFAVDIESFEGVHDTFWLSEHHLFTVQRWSWSPIGLSHSVGSTVTSYFVKSVKVFFFLVGGITAHLFLFKVLPAFIPVSPSKPSLFGQYAQKNSKIDIY